jgi:hypothetical protein
MIPVSNTAQKKNRNNNNSVFNSPKRTLSHNSPKRTLSQNSPKRTMSQNSPVPNSTLKHAVIAKRKVFFTFTVPWDRSDSEEKGRFQDGQGEGKGLLE